MTSRERVLAAIGHRNAGRIPFSVSPHGSLSVHGQKLLDIMLKYPGDFYDPRELKVPDRAVMEQNRVSTDIWGCVWETADLSIAGAIIRHPLADWAALQSYKMPEVVKVTAEQIKAAERTRDKYPVWAGIEQFFQIMQNLRGSEQIFMDLYIEPEKVRALIDRMMNEYHLPTLEEQLKLKPDIIGLGDDWGTQTQLLINPKLWRQFMKPVYRKFVEISHAAGAKTWFHSCGYTMEILEEFIEIGIDVINPQMPIMNAAEYGRIARNRITVFPDLSRQNILINGTPDEVQRHILEIYKHLGTPSGGLIGYCPIEPQMPLANVEAMLATVSAYSA